MFIAVTTGDTKKMHVPGRITYQLIRSELLELMVRIARHKYLERGVAKDIAEAVSMVFEMNWLKN